MIAACDDDDAESEAAIAVTTPADHASAARPSTPEPVFVDHADDGPDVFAGSWSTGQERLPAADAGATAMLAPDLDPEVLRAHGAEPMPDLAIPTEPVAGTIPSPAGFGHYCSMTWPSGGWALAWDTNGNDPCAFLIANSDPGGTIQRAGMISSASTNQVVTRCSDNTIFIFRGAGGGPLSAAFDAAAGHPGCIHTAAPQFLPIFQRAPWASGATVSPGTGVDFARGLAMTLNTFDFGWFSPPYADNDATIVDYRGRARTGGWINNHDAYDFGMARGTDLFAVANGNVVASRWLDTNCLGSDSEVQGEVYIRHTITRVPTTYNERFIAAYFHLQSLADLSPGASVVSGTYLGDSGHTGCSSDPHLHFAVVRETNVANARFATIQVPDGVGNNGGGRTIDPFGWTAPSNIDPWAWRAFPDGALSVHLWQPGAAPSRGNWALGD